MSEELLDCLGRRRSPAATSGFHVGRSPRNRGLRNPADPLPVEEIVAVMRAAGPDVYGDRLRATISCCGAPGCGSPRRSRSRRPILSLPGRGAGPRREERQTPRGRPGRVGVAHA